MSEPVVVILARLQALSATNDSLGDRSIASMKSKNKVGACGVH